MRICFVSQEDVVQPQGGTGTYVRNMSMALAARGHDVHAIVRRRDDAPAFEQVCGVSVHRVPAPGPTVLYSPLYFRRSRRAFAALHRRARFDIVQGNLPLMSSWGLRGELPPIVETVHCTVREELRAISGTALRRLNLNEVLTRSLSHVLYHRERRLLRRASHIIAVSQGLKRELVEQVACPAELVSVIPNGIDFERFAQATPDRTVVRRALGIDDGERVLLYLGRLVERKRAIDLVHALRLIRQHVPKARLVVAGGRTANAQRVERAAHELGLGAYVTFVDHVPYRDVPGYYAAADVYALPSAYEGFPFTVLEAMATGTPVVASDIPGIDEQITPGETGLLHPVGDVGAIARNILCVLQDADVAARLSAAARRHVQLNYTWDAIGARTELALRGVAT